MQQANDLLIQIGNLKNMKDGVLNWSASGTAGLIEILGRDNYDKIQGDIRSLIQPKIDALQKQFDNL